MSRRPHARTRWLAAAVSTATASLGLVALATAPAASAAALTPGNVLVVRVGDGAGSLSGAAAPVFLEEYSPAGTLVQTLPLPTADSGNQNALTLAGSATSEGSLAVAPNGVVTLAGYDAAPGTAAVAGTSTATVNRTIARLQPGGTLDTGTALTEGHSGGSIRGAVTDDGSRFWTAGANGGLRLTPYGGPTSTAVAAAPANVRVPLIADGQLYLSSASAPSVGISTVGTGLPTASGQTTALLPGLPTGTPPSPYGFALLDRDPAVPGADTLYVADDSGAPGGGVFKYSSDGTTWTASGSTRPGGDGVRGLSARTVADGTAQLAVTTTTGRTLLLSDTAAGAAPISLSAPATVATAGANTAFRGVAIVPGTATETAPSIATQPQDATVAEGGTTTLTVGASGTAPLTYQWFQGAAGDTSTPVGTDSPSFTTPALTTETSYWVRVTNALGSADSATATVSVQPPAPACTGPATAIPAVQGSGPAAAITGPVTVRGVVVGDYEGAQPALRGFYLQDPAGDGNPATSDGIFVFTNGRDDVANGDHVEVTGAAAEFQDQTQINATAVVDCPEAAPPVPPVDVSFPVTSATDLERYEGMLVRFPQTLSVTEHFQLGRFGQVTVSANGRLRQPTNIYPADDPRSAQLAQQNALSRVIVDDSSNGQNPDPIVWGRGGQPLSASNTLRGGDTLTGAVGVLTYTWAGNAASGNAYRLRPIGALGGQAQFTAANPRPTAPPAVGGTLKVASANLLNYFDTFAGCKGGVNGLPIDCRGASDEVEFERQAAKEVAALTSLDADVIGLMELENDGYGPDSAIQDLVGRLNAATAPGTWAFVDADAATGVTDSMGDDAIRVALLYRPGKVTPVPGTTFADGAAIHDRPPLATTFATGTGARTTVVVNHFKSKGCDGATGAELDQGDGQGCWNVRRTGQAQALADFIDRDAVPAAQDPDVLIVGDLNSYAKEDPIAVLEAAGYVNLVSAYGGENAYSYAFDGQWGYLDHALASASLRPQVTGAGDYHINADEPSVLDYLTDFKSAGQIASLYAPDRYRVSDHDPVLVGIAPTVSRVSATAVTSSANPSRFGQSVRFTAKVTAAAPGVPVTGTVRFYVAGIPVTGNITVAADGTAASPATRLLPPGRFVVEARYSGSARLAASSGRVTQTVRLL